MKKNKVIALILAVVLLAGLLFSTIFIIENFGHKCTGHDCPICLEINQAAQFISSIKFIPILSVTLTILSVFTLTRAVFKRVYVHKNTLISLKVEMLN
ncbi:hypothetical protein [Cellulosilyticum ruminicola]|uniref:hypothetical protein n=1 Tax=Cellulosilyticum ruminicola TaxID=425254 RepID=UPI0006D094B6|nr:hypothetical protein [Cellulosilyticum ruminicola]